MAEDPPSDIYSMCGGNVPSRFDLDETQIEDLFPFYFMVDHEMRIVRAGKGFLKLEKDTVVGETCLWDVLSINRPRRFAGKGLEALLKGRREEFCLTNRSGVMFKGQFVSMDRGRFGAFFGGPWFQKVEELETQGLSLNDFSASDPLSMFLMVLKHHEIANSELAEIQKLMNDHQIKARELTDLNRLLSEQSRQMEKSRRRAEELAEEKSRFLSMMSHEIRTPINGIMGGVELMRFQNLSDDQQASYEVISHSVNQLNSIVNRIFEFSNLEDRQLSLESEVVELYPLLQSSFNLFVKQAAERRISMDLMVCRDCPDRINVDPLRFSQIVMNLLENAIKFSTKGTVSLKVEMSQDESTADAIGVKPARYMVIAVEDQGQGIAFDKQKKIFSYFEMGDSADDRDQGGIGMGLAIVRHLVSLMEGRIELSSRPAQGTTVRIILPFDAIRPPDRHENGHSESPDANGIEIPTLAGKRVLIVDDNRINQLLIKKFAGRLSMEYEVANDGQEAVDHLRRGQFDIIVMDLQMPVLDGYSASLEIRTFNKDIPIIACSANSRSDVRQRIHSAGMNDFIPKPVDYKVLEDMMSEYLLGDPNCRSLTPSA